ncbi:lysophospholipid transporter LplT [Ostreibacterium oceani]|uniref:Lysophospholipid transporter LplT n=1 Tax=Ostreibacterium oceani TaxID=2654998 RepID=A0A6N7EVY4_9GAMM|nr:lysophospholipid transporter LplT [Ostreibacterium oceani]MPV85247.1 lysophospholipid transporter LplT [Ostreibacterium oceani]
MIFVVIAQFLSALADNILLFLILGILKESQAPNWHIPMIQQVFLMAFIILAPFVGAIADSIAKNRVMMAGNLLKLAGVIFLLAGGNAFISYTIVGIGAAIYSPAKYGILKEITGEAFLVKANALIEGSTIVAILTGVVLGGLLADFAVQQGQFWLVIGLTASIYALAAFSNIYIPKTPPERPQPIQFLPLLRSFAQDFSLLWRDKTARIALLGTGIFYGVGVTMRFLLVAWVPIALQITDNKTPAILNAMVAIGVVIGAGLASFIPLRYAKRAIFSGVGMGVLLSGLMLSQTLSASYFFLICIGISGGVFLIPLNALLQRQGHRLIGGGRAVAIQNLIDNLAMLVLLALYIFLIKAGISVISVGILFGLLTIALVSGITYYAYRHAKLLQE